MKAPRNFTLTPQMVRVPQAMVFRWPRVLAMTSALASLLLVLVIVSDLLVFRGDGGTQLAAEPAALEFEMMAEDLSEQAPDVFKESPEAEALMLDEPAGIPPEEPGDTEISVREVETPLENKQPYPNPDILQVEEMAAESEAEATLEAEIIPLPDEDLAPEMMLTTPEEAATAGLEAEQPRPSEEPAAPVALWVEIGLGLLVLASGLGAFYLNRRGW